MKKKIKKIFYILSAFLLISNNVLAVTTNYNISSDVSGFSASFFDSKVLTVINMVGAIATIFGIINLMIGFTRWKFLAGYNVDERNKAFHILKQALVGLMIMIIVLLIDIFIK